MLKISRWGFRRTVALLHHGALSSSPILFANSFPKSGTHLLTQVLKGFVELGPVVDSGLPAIVAFDGPSGQPREQQKILKEIRRLRNGDISYGHLHAIPEIVNELAQKAVAHFFIFRDPRDVVVSHVYYVTEIEKNHIHHDHYKNELRGFDERLMTSILGRPDIEVPFPDIGTRFEPYLGWLDIPAVLSMQFEDLVRNRSNTLIQMIKYAVHCGFELRVPIEDAVIFLERAIDPAKSPTFRSGKIGKWKEYFNEEHTKIFKNVCGDILIRLGYEKDNNW